MPRIRPIFAIFDPRMFPRIKPFALLVIAEIDVNNSGAEVATDTTVSPTSIGGIPINAASVAEASERVSPAFIS